METSDNMANNTFHSNLAIPPGEFLEEVIEDLGMSKDELARRMERPPSKLSPIFKGDKAITPDTALRLEKVVGVPAHIWTGLEAKYRLTLARLDEEDQKERLKNEAKQVTKFCYNELVKLGEVEKRSKPIDKVYQLLNYFGTMSLETIPTLHRYQPAYRLGTTGERSPEALAAWIRLGERRGASMNCRPFNKNRLKENLDDLRVMTLDKPDIFMPNLHERLASCGVALIVCPHFPKTKAHGATFQLRNDKVVLMITIRGSWSDIFWFSLFHELGHILLHSMKEVILEDHIQNQREEEANAFASDTLIPPKEYQCFVNGNRFNLNSIKSFARQININPGIIVGRLQHDKLMKPQWCNKLRDRYKWM